MLYIDQDVIKALRTNKLTLWVFEKTVRVLNKNRIGKIKKLIRFFGATFKTLFF